MTSDEKATSGGNMASEDTKPSDKNMASNNPKRTLGFMSLAGEVRNQIYEIFIQELPPASSPECLLKNPAFALSNERIRQELMTLILSKTTVIIVSLPSLWPFSTFLQSIHTGMTLITKIEIPDFTELASSPPRAGTLMDFLVSLPNITELKITVRLDHVQLPLVTNGQGKEGDADAGHIEGNDTEIGVSAQRVSQFTREHGLSRLGELARLKQITVMCEPGDSDILELWKWAIVEGLGPWMAKMFQLANSGQPISRVPILWTEGMTAVAGFCFDVRQ